jgi:metal-responsive CopG/Arc/MetJ family transcriptional regulator
MEHKRVALTVSLPHDLAQRFGRLAKAEAKNKSQLFRDMFQTYQQRRMELEFFELQRYGVRQAREKGILTEADVEALVLQGR